MANYKTLDAWKFSMQLVKEVYLLAKKFPKEETYALTSQMKRAAASVPSNIAEGFGKAIQKRYATIFTYFQRIFIRTGRVIEYCSND